MLTPKDVHDKEFTTHRLCEGYDMDQVDAFLDEVAETITAIGREWVNERSARIAVESRCMAREARAKAAYVARARRRSRGGTGLSTALRRSWREQI
ncbi:DivIVA domain-containing protein [Bifidobacterium actinocoloniiforme]|uniref:DivIVA domain-containing protein n=1 Tax=Bifidobacterium actinocoloniiforme TaxID=638619 RepID=UPI000529CD22|nr:DivIVA domain-containing protein [Bifidobacterium actinocoloniiforme]AKV55096.1 hypothetical protein AB656_01190 [Bifidobacterium actinocoloniiforme DSM 22766]